MRTGRTIHWRTGLFIILFSGLVGLGLTACDLDDEPDPVSTTFPATLLPTDTKVLLPDLVIRSVIAVEDSGSACPSPDQPVSTHILVENRGEKAAGPFVVRLNQDQQLVRGPLEPGDWIEVVFPEFDPSPYIYVDATSLVTESDESNNQVFQALALPTMRPECQPSPTPEIKTQEALMVLEGHTAKIWGIRFSPDGKLIASGSVDNTLRLWNVPQNRLIRTMMGHPFPILKVEFSANGATLFTGSTDGVIRSWDVVSSQLLYTFDGHSGWITGLDISKDGKYMVSCAEDDTVRFWRLPNGVTKIMLDEGMSGVRGVVFSPDSLAVAWGESDGTIRFWSLDGKWLQVLKAGTAPIRSLRFSPDGKYLAAGSSDGVIRIIDVEKGSVAHSLFGHLDAVNELVFSPDGVWLVSASEDHSLRLWKFGAEEFSPLPEQVYLGHTGGVTSVDFSPNSPLLASGSEDATIRLWQIPEE